MYATLSSLRSFLNLDFYHRSLKSMISYRYAKSSLILQNPNSKKMIKIQIQKRE